MDTHARAGLVKPVVAATIPKVGEVAVRRLRPTDLISEITGLLHRAYAGQMAMGLKPLAGRQDDTITHRRCNSGECYLAVVPDAGHPAGERIVGTILFHEVEPDEGPTWFKNAFVDSFSQFGVDPDLQGIGIGRLLLGTAERRAAECGAKELACSMAEPDAELMRYYLSKGYRLIEHWQWPYTNYRSAILSKTLPGP
ncbi:MAG: GNAT family N-acetyltransferase [Phycisphaeraceae bacterium]|nr:MAG: GNAT family N-acetyltransferase [Phycisphaeraceae bacterium]